VIARDEASRRGLELEVGSAGVWAAAGRPAYEGAEIVARRHGLDLGPHTARKLTRDLAESVDLILAMEDGHLRLARDLAPNVPARLLTEYLQKSDPRRGRQVPDPVGGWLARYEEAFDLLKASISGFLDQLEDAGRRSE
jgi:protein-tyrosine phosphatase